jgi:pimeloyl-ACP methyl ester carboxylesterase
VNRGSFLGLLPAVASLSSVESQRRITAAPTGISIGKGHATFDHSLALVRRMQASDDDSILPVGRTTLYDHGRATDLAVVLFHGFTNCPVQYALFAKQLHARGCNVLVPRLPEHGDVNRMTTRLERMTAEQLVETASQAVDAALGLGRRIAVSGLSLGGLLSAWLATQRSDIDLSVPVAPAFGIDHVWFPISVLTAGVMRGMPADRYVWWNPFLKEKNPPMHAYPRYPVRALGQNYLIGEWAISAQPPFPGRDRTKVIFALNPRDPAVNNDAVVQLSQSWFGSNALSSSIAWMDGFPPMHDVIDPDNTNACPKLCYPPLIDLIMSGRTTNATS